MERLLVLLAMLPPSSGTAELELPSSTSPGVSGSAVFLLPGVLLCGVFLLVSPDGCLVLRGVLTCEGSSDALSKLARLFWGVVTGRADA